MLVRFSKNIEADLPLESFWGWREFNYSRENEDKAGLSGTCQQKAAIYNSVRPSDASFKPSSIPRMVAPPPTPLEFNPHSGPALVG